MTGKSVHLRTHIHLHTLSNGSAIVTVGASLVQGFNNVNAVLKGGSDYAATLLVQILLAKILVTSLCRGSGEMQATHA